MSEALPDRDPLAVVQASREQGAAQFDPVGFGVIEALARRAEAQHGQTRQRLMQRVDELLAAHAAKAQPRSAAPAATESAARAVALKSLSDLIDRLGRSPQVRAPQSLAPSDAVVRQREAPSASRANAVTAFKGTWSRLRADQRLREALAQVPSGAGPLNSSHLINRALQAMRELSPAYLDAFMQHVDTLLWLEQASGAGDLTTPPAPPSGEGRAHRTRAPRKS